MCVCECVCLGVGVACRNACINKFDIGVTSPSSRLAVCGAPIALGLAPSPQDTIRLSQCLRPLLAGCVCGIHIIVGHVSYECKLDANVNNLRG